MKAVVWHGVGDIRLDDVADPSIQQPTDAVVRLTASAICGSRVGSRSSCSLPRQPIEVI